jgi:hypothetical protein
MNRMTLSLIEATDRDLDLMIDLTEKLLLTRRKSWSRLLSVIEKMAWMKKDS